MMFTKGNSSVRPRPIKQFSCVVVQPVWLVDLVPFEPCLNPGPSCIPRYFSCTVLLVVICHLVNKEKKKNITHIKTNHLDFKDVQNYKVATVF